MRILHVITSLRTGGAEKLLVDLLPLLRADGLQVDLCLFNGKKTIFYEILQKTGVKILDFGERNSVYNPLNVIKLRRLAKQYDIIHSHNSSPQFYSIIACLGLRIKLFTTEHNTTNRRRNWIAFKYVDRWMYNRYDNVICISRKSEENLREYLKTTRAQISTINNGIDTLKFNYALQSELLEKIAPKSKKIVMVAGYREQKDQDTLIKSLKYLPAQFHLFLIGDGVRRMELVSITKRESLINRIHFLGIRTDIPELLKAADYVVMSSHYEGLSLSSIEGMCCGKPFLASDVDGLREVVEGAGILFPHQNAKALANEITKLDEIPEYYQMVADRCCEAGTQYDISIMKEKYKSLYLNSKE